MSAQQEEWWLNDFKLMTKGDDSLGSSGWRVAPSTVLILIRGIEERAMRRGREEGKREAFRKVKDLSL